MPSSSSLSVCCSDSVATYPLDKANYAKINHTAKKYKGIQFVDTPRGKGEFLQFKPSGVFMEDENENMGDNGSCNNLLFSGGRDANLSTKLAATTTTTKFPRLSLDYMLSNRSPPNAFAAAVADPPIRRRNSFSDFHVDHFCEPNTCRDVWNEKKSQQIQTQQPQQPQQPQRRKQPQTQLQEPKSFLREAGTMVGGRKDSQVNHSGREPSHKLTSLPRSKSARHLRTQWDENNQNTSSEESDILDYKRFEHEVENDENNWATASSSNGHRSNISAGTSSSRMMIGANNRPLLRMRQSSTGNLSSLRKQHSFRRQLHNRCDNYRNIPSRTNSDPMERKPPLRSTSDRQRKPPPRSTSNEKRPPPSRSTSDERTQPPSRSTSEERKPASRSSPLSDQHQRNVPSRTTSNSRKTRSSPGSDSCRNRSLSKSPVDKCGQRNHSSATTTTKSRSPDRQCRERRSATTKTQSTSAADRHRQTSNKSSRDDCTRSTSPADGKRNSLEDSTRPASAAPDGDYDEDDDYSNLDDCNHKGLSSSSDQQQQLQPQSDSGPSLSETELKRRMSHRRRCRHRAVTPPKKKATTTTITTTTTTSSPDRIPTWEHRKQISDYRKNHNYRHTTSRWGGQVHHHHHHHHHHYHHHDTQQQQGQNNENSQTPAGTMNGAAVEGDDAEMSLTDDMLSSSEKFVGAEEEITTNGNNNSSSCCNIINNSNNNSSSNSNSNNKEVERTTTTEVKKKKFGLRNVISFNIMQDSASSILTWTC